MHVHEGTHMSTWGQENYRMDGKNLRAGGWGQMLWKAGIWSWHDCYEVMLEVMLTHIRLLEDEELKNLHRELRRGAEEQVAFDVISSDVISSDVIVIGRLPIFQWMTLCTYAYGKY